MAYKLSWDNITLPILVWDRNNQSQHTVAQTKIWLQFHDEIELNEKPNIFEYLEHHSGRMNINEIPSLLRSIASQCVAKELGISLCFPYFRSKTNAITAQFDVRLTEHGNIDFVLRLCLALTHQRQLDVSIRSQEFIWIESLDESLKDLPVLDISSLRKEIKDRIAQFNPTWVHVLYTELHPQGMNLSQEWSWPSELSKASAPHHPQKTPKSNQSFGGWLKEQRIHRQLSQQELGTALQISNSNLSRLEAGLKEPSAHLLMLLANHWSYSLDHLLLRARHPSTEMLEVVAGDIDGFLYWMNARSLRDR